MRTKNIDNFHKRNLLEWFMLNESFKTYEAKNVLCYLLSDQTFLQHLHIVDDIENAPRGLMISSKDVDESGLQFMNKSMVTSRLKDILIDIRKNRGTDLYLQLNFKHSFTKHVFLTALGENPYASNEALISEKDKHLASSFLETCLKNGNEKRFKEAIDSALDQRDESLFYDLTKKEN